ncbi:MAG: hypothetical protein ACRENO_00860, partial [Thermodesulfobacteriota bacterium]
ITNSTISGNSANNDGGGIINIGGTATATITNSTISGNSANDDGGGIINIGGTATATITNSTISGNNADGRRRYYQHRWHSRNHKQHCFWKHSRKLRK